MKLLQKTFVGTALVLMVASGMAYAGPSQFAFMGQVTYTDGSLSGVQVGTTFSGSFTYDATMAPSYAWPTFASYSLGAGSQIAANIGGHTIVANKLSGWVQNDAKSNVEDGISLSGGYPLLVDGRSHSDGSFGFQLTSRPGNTGVLSSTGLPTSYDVAAFDGHSSLTYGWLQRDGGQTGRIVGFAVTSITTPVPEPESYAMMLAGVALLGGVTLRRFKK